MFLSDRQVRRLTGENEKSAQIRWLVAQGVRHWVNAAGKPIVPVSEIEAPGTRATAPGWSPDFSRMEA